MLPTLATFISETDDKNRWPRNSYVKAAGFDSCYVRRTERYLDGEMWDCLDLANITARSPGAGAFKALVTDLRAKYPCLTLYVECVQTELFRGGLIRMGFLRHRDSDSFYLFPRHTC